MEVTSNAEVDVNISLDAHQNGVKKTSNRSSEDASGATSIVGGQSEEASRSKYNVLFLVVF